MLLPQLSVVGTFAFQGAARRVSIAVRGNLLDATTYVRRSSGLTSLRMSTAESETKVVAGVRQLCDAYDGFILDQFGVLHGEDTALYVKGDELEMAETAAMWKPLLRRSESVPHDRDVRTC